MSHIPGSNASLAVLIDADNATAACIAELLSEVAKLGIASVKRAYGDWTTPQLNTWKETLLRHSIQPIQQFRYTTGKNATDCAMIIDAMDLLHAGRLDGFCLVSSDSDFTRLASRIRESGRKAYGFGRKDTPEAFVAACDRFIYTDNLSIIQDSARSAQSLKMGTKELRQDTGLLNLIRSAIEACSDEVGWASLGAVGAHIYKTKNDFDSRSFGYPKLSGLVEAIGLFEMEKNGNLPRIRDARKKKEVPPACTVTEESRSLTQVDDGSGLPA